MTDLVRAKGLDQSSFPLALYVRSRQFVAFDGTIPPSIHLLIVYVDTFFSVSWLR